MPETVNYRVYSRLDILQNNKKDKQEQEREKDSDEQLDLKNCEEDHELIQ